MAVQLKQLKNKKPVDILLAAYNGEKYIAEQINSILNQTVQDFRLIVQDDCSTDSTVAIVQEFCQRDSRVVLFQNTVNLGYVKNFEHLIKISHSDVIFLSDQDDVWHPEKIELLLKVLNSDRKPILVYSDLKVVDSNLSIVSDSLWSMLGLTPLRGVVNNYNDTNILTGCSCCFKQELKQYILPFNPKIPHDAQIFKQALLYGVEYVDQSLVFYRQHNNNIIGAAKSKLQLVYKTGILSKKRITKIIPVLSNDKHYNFKILQPEDAKSFYLKPLNKNNKLLSDFVCKIDGVHINFDRGVNIELLDNNTIKLKSNDSKLIYNKKIKKGSVVEIDYVASEVVLCV